MAQLVEYKGKALYEFTIVPGNGYRGIPPGFDFSDGLNPLSYDLSVRLNPYTVSNRPYLASNMRTVVNSEVAQKLNNVGAIGVIHQFEPLAKRVETVRALYGQKVDLDKFPEANVVDSDNTPLIFAAVGYEEAEEAALALFQAGARGIIFDSANGYTPSFLRKIHKATQNVRNKAGGEKVVFGAGNVATPEGVEAILNIPSMDLVKLGVGSGTGCITGKHGVHVPQFTVLYDSMPVIVERKKIGISDGGAKDPRGFSIALTMAHMVMAGGYFAATYEAPNEKGEDDEGKKYARYQGSASWEDRTQRAAAYPDRYTVDRNGYRPSEGRAGWLPIKGTIYDVVAALDSTMRLDMNYVGGVDLKTKKYTLPEFRQHAVLMHLSEQAQRDLNKGAGFVKDIRPLGPSPNSV